MQNVSTQNNIKYKLLSEIPYQDSFTPEDEKLINNNNQLSLSPFWVKEEQKILQVESQFISNQLISQAFKENVLAKNPDFTLEIVEKIPIPHQVQDPKKIHIIQDIYQSYHNLFQYQKWFSRIATPQDSASNNNDRIKTYLYNNNKTQIIKLKNFEVKELIKISHIRVLTDRQLFSEDIEFLEDLQNIIDEYIKSSQNENKDFKGIFVKNQDKSAKNNEKVEPLFTALEVFSQLTRSKDVLNVWKEDQDNYLILMPFTPIDTSKEFRVFVINQKVTAVAQQKWYQKLQYVPQPSLIQSILDLYYNELQPKLKYKDIVLDIYIDSITNKACLIECNPGGIWASSGSSLFNWKTDTNMLTNGDCVDLKFYCEQNVIDEFQSNQNNQ